MTTDTIDDKFVGVIFRDWSKECSDTLGRLGVSDTLYVDVHGKLYIRTDAPLSEKQIAEMLKVPNDQVRFDEQGFMYKMTDGGSSFNTHNGALLKTRVAELRKHVGYQPTPSPNEKLISNTFYGYNPFTVHFIGDKICGFKQYEEKK